MITRTMLTGLAQLDWSWPESERTAERWNAYCGERGAERWHQMGVIRRGVEPGEFSGVLYLTEKGERVLEIARDALPYGGEPISEERIAELAERVNAAIAG